MNNFELTVISTSTTFSENWLTKLPNILHKLQVKWNLTDLFPVMKYDISLYFHIGLFKAQYKKVA